MTQNSDANYFLEVFNVGRAPIKVRRYAGGYSKIKGFKVFRSVT